MLLFICRYVTMPDRCCVAGSRGNYDPAPDKPAEIVSVFRFPTGPELKAKWIRLIPRKNFTVGPRTVVCERHFAPPFIVRSDSVKRPDGSRPTLTKDAYPSIFPSLICLLDRWRKGRRRKIEIQTLTLEMRTFFARRSACFFWWFLFEGQWHG